jgi:GcrA cell cycle regulator
MSWTDERVEQLRQLWLDGKSASQIAATLANGITRNAVIGKVHRLGLSGRVKAPTQNAPRPRIASKPAPQRPMATQRPQGPRTHGANALAYAPRAETRPIERPVEEVVIPMSERVTIMELKEAMCRWPMGDPATPDFRYCGGKSPIGVPYCTYHSRVAYQPAQDRRNRRPGGPTPPKTYL